MDRMMRAFIFCTMIGGCVLSLPSDSTIANPNFESRTRSVSKWGEVGIGCCGAYSKGVITLTYCKIAMQQLQDHDDLVTKIYGYLSNEARVAACDISVSMLVPDGSQLVSLAPIEARESFTLDPGQTLPLDLILDSAAIGKPDSAGFDVDFWRACNATSDHGPISFAVKTMPAKLPGRVELPSAIHAHSVGKNVNIPMSNKDIDFAPQIEHRSASKWGPVRPGSCGIYTKGLAEIAFCLQRNSQYGQDVTMVEGFFVNKGNVDVCQIKVATVRPDTYVVKSIWPEWITDPSQSWLGPEQSAAAGFTADDGNSGGGQAVLGLDIEDFNDCSGDMTINDAEPLHFRTDHFGNVFPDDQLPGVEGSRKELKVEKARHPTLKGPVIDQRNRTHYLPVKEGECGVFTRGSAELAYCVGHISGQAHDMQKLSGLLINTGNTAVCGMRAFAIVPQGAQLKTIWPEWLSEANETYLDPGQVADMGLTLSPRTQQNKALSPGFDLESFYDCSQDGLSGQPTSTKFHLDTLQELRPSRVEMSESDRLSRLTGRGLQLAQRNVSTYGLLAPGQCRLYSHKMAELVLCTESFFDIPKGPRELRGLLRNRGKMPVCDIHFVAVTPDGSLLRGFRPEAWSRPNATFLNPGEVVDLALLVDTSGQTGGPGLDVDSYSVCTAEGQLVEGQSSLLMVQNDSLSHINPHRHSSLAEREGLRGGRLWSSWPDIRPGECGIFSRGTAEIAYCIDTVTNQTVKLEQVSGFLVNVGKVPVCDVKLARIVPNGARLQSTWGFDNATQLQQGQVVALGLAVVSQQQRKGRQYIPPAVDVDSFHECIEPGLPTTSMGFHKAPIDSIRPAVVPVMPFESFASIARGETGIPEGKCAIYSKRDVNASLAQATLCVESVLRWAVDILQVNAVLTNSGKAPLCALQLALGSNQTYQSIWPEWAADSSWLQDFAPGHTTAVGFTAPGRVDNSVPLMTVRNFNICGHPGIQHVDPRTSEGPVSTGLEVMLVDLSEIRKRDGDLSASKNGIPQYKAALASLRMRRIEVNDSAPAQVAAAGKRSSAAASSPVAMLQPGECGVFKKGAAELSLCLDSIVRWGEDVQQLNAFMVNTGKVAICDIDIQPQIYGRNATYSTWPEWATNGSCSISFKPGQVTATGPLTDVAPSVTISRFRDCQADDSIAVAPPTSETRISIENVQPRRISPADLFSMDYSDKSMEQTSPLAIPEGTCGLYSRGQGQLALCIESVLEWGTDLTQVNGYLQNVGPVRLCNIKIIFDVDNHLSAWPDWAATGIWERNYQPDQVSAIGYTARWQPDRPSPTIAVHDFEVCDGSINGPIAFNLTDMTNVKRLVQLQHFLSDKTAAANASVASMKVVEENVPAGKAMAYDKCSKFEHGGARLMFCAKAPAKWGKDIVQVAGEVQNVGEVPICDLRIETNVARDAILSANPTSLATGIKMQERLIQQNKIKIGFTSLSSSHPQEGAKLYLVSFQACGSPASTQDKPPMNLLEVKPLPPGTVVGVPKQPLDEPESQEDQHISDWQSLQLLASKQKRAEPTTWDNIKWDECGYYTGKDGASEVALCWKSARAWKDADLGRIVQANLILVNTGNMGVCNLTVNIENIDQEVGDHYPEWVDENGVDTFPTYPGWYAPQQICNLGAAVPVGVSPKFTSCDQPRPKAEQARKIDCQIYRQHGVSLNLCVYTSLKEWTEYKGPRIVMVEGFIENVGQTPACNITVNIDKFQDATAKWGEWMPTFPYKLAPSSSIKFGANIPFKKGTPKTALASFDKCDSNSE